MRRTKAAAQGGGISRRLAQERMIMKTNKEIDETIGLLKLQRLGIPRHSFFGDDNHANIDAQVEVLEKAKGEKDAAVKKSERSATARRTPAAANLADAVPARRVRLAHRGRRRPGRREGHLGREGPRRGEEGRTIMSYENEYHPNRLVDEEGGFVDDGMTAEPCPDCGAMKMWRWG